jgi:hypothetical protein
VSFVMCGARVMQQPFVFLAALWDVGLVRLCRRLSTARHNMGTQLHKTRNIFLSTETPATTAPIAKRFSAW